MCLLGLKTRWSVIFICGLCFKCKVEICEKCCFKSNRWVSQWKYLTIMVENFISSSAAFGAYFGLTS